LLIWDEETNGLRPLFQTKQLSKTLEAESEHLPPEISQETESLLVAIASRLRSLLLLLNPNLHFHPASH
jgi:hypothetical protein